MATSITLRFKDNQGCICRAGRGGGIDPLLGMPDVQDAQLSQRDRAAGCISFGKAIEFGAAR